MIVLWIGNKQKYLGDSILDLAVDGAKTAVEDLLNLVSSIIQDVAGRGLVTALAYDLGVVGCTTAVPGENLRQLVFGLFDKRDCDDLRLWCLLGHQ